MLSVAACNPFSTGTAMIDSIMEVLPQDTGGHDVPGWLEPLRDVSEAAEAPFIYQAFPGEVNNVEVWGADLNTILYIDDSPDVAMYRIPIVWSTNPISLTLSPSAGLKLFGHGRRRGTCLARRGSRRHARRQPAI